MSRKKVKLEWIEDNAARKAIYRKRVKGVMKKARELSILCGVDACVITYFWPYQRQPEVWPSPAEVERVIAAFRNLSENDQTKKKVLNQDDFVRQRILKAMDELVKQQMKNRKKEIENLRTQCLGGDGNINGNGNGNGNGMLLEGLERKDVLDLIWAIDNQLEAVKKRIGAIDASGSAAAAAAAAEKSFDLSIDALNNQPLTEQNPNDENMGNTALLGDPLLVYDISDFWGNPDFL